MVDVRKMNKLESKLLHAIREGKVRKLMTLLEREIDINFQDELGKTPLIHAACCDIEDVRNHVVRLLLRSGSDVNIQDNFGRTALMYACMDIDRMDLVRLIIRQRSGDPNIADEDGNSAIMHSVVASNAEAISAMISSSITKSKLDLNLKNKSGMSALEIAIKLQKFQCCKVLATEGGARSSSVNDRPGMDFMLNRDMSYNSQNTLEILNGQKKKPRTGGSTPTENNIYPARSGTPLPERSQSRTPMLDPRNDYLRKFKQDRPDLVLSRTEHKLRSHSKLSYNREPSQQSVSSHNFSDQQRVPKRALTPISSRQRNSNQSLTPIEIESSPSPFEITATDASLFGNRMRLPSIPSGKRLCLVNKQNGLEHPGTEV